MLQELEELRDGALRDVADAETEEKLEELRVRHLGRKSQLRSIMRAIGSAAPEERPALGPAAGQAQKAIQQAFAARQSDLEAGAEAGDAFDLTLPGRRPLAGRLPLPLPLPPPGADERPAPRDAGAGVENSSSSELLEAWAASSALALRAARRASLRALAELIG